MKTNRILAFALGALVAVSCADFEAMNHNPKAVNSADAKPYYALNKAIVADQQNPNDAERVFVLYWADIARQDGENSSRAVGASNDEWAGCLYSLSKNSITAATNAVNIVDSQINALAGHEGAFYPNVKAAARIWRVYLMTEFVDSFGSFTTDFEAITPEYKSVEDCYLYMLQEVSQAVNDINTSVAPESDLEKDSDPAYKFDATKWKNFGISMWMRIAMRLSEVKPDLAKTEFAKAAAAGTGIVENAGNFRIIEGSGWDDLAGVMSRTWDWQSLSQTMANLTTNLGGVNVTEVLKNTSRLYKDASATRLNAYTPYIKDADEYLGIKMVGRKFKKNDPAKEGTDTELVQLYEDCTDSPTQGYFFDGLPSKLDPRALAYFSLPGDYDNRIETGYCSFPSIKMDPDYKKWKDGKRFIDGKVKVHLCSSNYTTDGGKTADGRDSTAYHFADPTIVDATFSYNGLVCGYGYDDKSELNGLINGDPYYNANMYGVTYPALQERYRNCQEYRVFFGAWETHFLKAEAIIRGYITGDAKAEYEAGIKASFEYLGLGEYANAYISGTDYNRVGTSVAWNHTAEPQSFQIDFFNPETGKLEKTTYNYPTASKTLYGKALNDQLAKIITQKYIANCPWLPLENWSDHRRTGLPFWETPVSSTELNYLDGWTASSSKAGQKVGFYAQRMKYPAKFNNASPEQYQNALSLMGMTEENTVTPLWWAKQR
ncbi:MAG: SusD/RagB family nutrient-binding outer membrane lipoprotein [Bacteroidales bacterium]|nr:SusD/RagB family nutrient-binding outer membrane lipoprotein [Bacteroidales bacterium]